MFVDYVHYYYYYYFIPELVGLTIRERVELKPWIHTIPFAM